MSKVQNDPRRHHYIPQSYLANFTKDGTVKSPLWVFNQETGQQWQSRPKGIAFENDFHTVETVNGLDSRTFEEVFSLVEGNAKPVINQICETLVVPPLGSEEYNWLINFIALLCARTPARRKHFSESMAEVYKKVGEMSLSSKDYYERVMREINEKNGQEVSQNVSYEEMKEFVGSDRYEISFHNNFHMKTFMTVFDAIIDPLGHRTWCVVYSPHIVGDFICSDNPVALRFVKEVKGPFNSPGHGLLNTEVSIPLSPRVALLGRFEVFHPLSGIAPNRKTVAIINSYTGMYADRYVFSRKRDFIWYANAANVSTIDDFRRMISKKDKRNQEGD